LKWQSKYLAKLGVDPSQLVEKRLDEEEKKETNSTQGDQPKGLLEQKAVQCEQTKVVHKSVQKPPEK